MVQDPLALEPVGEACFFSPLRAPEADDELGDVEDVPDPDPPSLEPLLDPCAPVESEADSLPPEEPPFSPLVSFDDVPRDEESDRESLR